MCFRVLSRTSSSLWIHICPYLLIKLSTWIAHAVCGMAWFPWFPHWPLIANNKIKHHIATKAILQLKSPKSSSFPFIQLCETNSLETDAFPAREFRWWQMAFFFFFSPGVSSYPRELQADSISPGHASGDGIWKSAGSLQATGSWPEDQMTWKSSHSHAQMLASVVDHTLMAVLLLKALGSLTTQGSVYPPESWFFSPLSSKWSPLPWITCVHAAVFSFYLEIEEIAIHTCEFNICFLVPTQTLFLLEKKIFLSSGTPLLLLIFSKHCVHTAMQAGCAG